MLKPDDTLADIAKVLAKQSNFSPYEEQPEEVKQQLLDDAEEIWDAVFADISPLSGWWLGQVAHHPLAKMVFILPVGPGAGSLLAAGDTPDELVELAHKTSINWRKDGSVSHFQVSKIGVEE